MNRLEYAKDTVRKELKRQEIEAAKASRKLRLGKKAVDKPR
jgi:hypothetical protein